LLARLKLKRDKALKRCPEGVEDFVAQVVLAFFAFINNAKVLKKLDDLLWGSTKFRNDRKHIADPRGLGSHVIAR
jgi:hypothetical protein